MTPTATDMVDESTYLRMEQQLRQLALIRAHNLLDFGCCRRLSTVEGGK